MSIYNEQAEEVQAAVKNTWGGTPGLRAYGLVSLASIITGTTVAIIGYAIVSEDLENTLDELRKERAAAAAAALEGL